MTDKAASFNQKPGVGRHVRSILVLNSLIARNVYRQIVAAEDFAATGDAAAGEALDLADRRVEPLKTSPVGARVAPKNEAHGCRPCAALATITGPHFHI